MERKSPERIALTGWAEKKSKVKKVEIKQYDEEQQAKFIAAHPQGALLYFISSHKIVRVPAAVIQGSILDSRQFIDQDLLDSIRTSVPEGTVVGEEIFSTDLAENELVDIINDAQGDMFPNVEQQILSTLRSYAKVRYSFPRWITASLAPIAMVVMTDTATYDAKYITKIGKNWLIDYGSKESNEQFGKNTRVNQLQSNEQIADQLADLFPIFIYEHIPRLSKVCRQLLLDIFNTIQNDDVWLHFANQVYQSPRYAFLYPYLTSVDVNSMSPYQLLYNEEMLCMWEITVGKPSVPEDIRDEPFVLRLDEFFNDRYPGLDDAVDKDEYKINTEYNMNAPNVAREMLNFYCGFDASQLDLSRSVITGSAILAAMMYVRQYTDDKKSESRAVNVSKLWHLVNFPAYVIDDIKDLHIGNDGQGNTWYDPVPLRPASDIDILVHDAKDDLHYRSIAQWHIAQIITLTTGKEGKSRWVIKETERKSGTMFFMYDRLGIFRSVQIYRSTLRQIMTHHVAPARGWYGEDNRETGEQRSDGKIEGKEGKTKFFATMSFVRSLYNKYLTDFCYFPSNKSPMLILKEYVSRGFTFRGTWGIPLWPVEGVNQIITRDNTLGIRLTPTQRLPTLPVDPRIHLAINETKTVAEQVANFQAQQKQYADNIARLFKEGKIQYQHPVVGIEGSGGELPEWGREKEDVLPLDVEQIPDLVVPSSSSSSGSSWSSSSSGSSSSRSSPSAPVGLMYPYNPTQRAPSPVQYYNPGTGFGKIGQGKIYNSPSNGR